MNRRWQPPPPKSPQLRFPLEPPSRGRFEPAEKSGTKTSTEARDAVGVGAIAQAMVGTIEKQAHRVRLAGAMLAVTVRKEVLDWLRANPAGGSAHQIAHALKRSFLTVSPRLSELRRMGLIVDSGRRTINAHSGHRAILWAQAQSKSDE